MTREEIAQWVNDVHHKSFKNGWKAAVKGSDNVIRLIVRMAKKDIAFTEEEAVKFYHEEMK